VTAGDKNGNKFFFATKTGDPGDNAFIENWDHMYLFSAVSNPTNKRSALVADR
jgi:hypothetical protein